MGKEQTISYNSCIGFEVWSIRIYDIPICMSLTEAEGFSAEGRKKNRVVYSYRLWEYSESVSHMVFIISFHIS